MSSHKTQAFIATGEFGPATREHPALVFGEEATQVFDSRDHRTLSEWVTQDFSTVGPDGLSGQGNPQENFERGKQMYDKLLTSYRHIPALQIVIDTEDGYKNLCHGSMCGDFLAVSGLNPVKASAPDGSQWDIVVPFFAEFDLVKDSDAKHHGLLIRQTRFVIDQNQVVKSIKSKGLSVPGFT